MPPWPRRVASASPASWTRSEHPHERDEPHPAGGAGPAGHPHRPADGREAPRRRDHLRAAHPRAPRPHRAGQRRPQRLPGRRRRGSPGHGQRGRCRPRRRRGAPPSGRRADRGEGHRLHAGPAHHRRLPDVGGLGAALRRHDRAAPQGRPHADPRQDQHGRVRDGLLHRALRLRPHPQPVGRHPHPRWLRRWLRRRSGRAPCPAGDRLRHRRLHPPAGRGHRIRGLQAHLRRSLAPRHHRPGLLAGPDRPVLAHRRRLRGPPRGHRWPRPGRLHQHRRPGPRRDRRCTLRPGGQRRHPVRPARRRGEGAHGRRRLPGRREGALRPAHRPAPRGRRRDRRGVLPVVRPGHGRLLPDPPQRGVLQPGPLRRHALRPARRARWGGRPLRGAGHGRLARRRLRRGGQAPHHPGHLRPVQRLLRRVLRQGPEGAHPHPARLRGRVRAVRRPALPDGAHHGLPAG